MSSPLSLATAFYTMDVLSVIWVVSLNIDCSFTSIPDEADKAKGNRSAKIMMNYLLRFSR